MDYKIIVAHPGKQHSYRTASALKKAGILENYITTIYDSKSSYTITILKKILPDREKERIATRKNNDLSDHEVVQFCVISGYIEAFLARFPACKKLYTVWQQWTADRFGKKAAKLAMKSRVDAVIMYDTNAKKCFEILKRKAPEIKCILDVSHINRQYQQEKIFNEYQGDFVKECREYRFPKWFLRKTESENNNTDYFVVPSGFVAESLAYSGIPFNKMFIVSYGSNFENVQKKRKTGGDKKLIFLFVGKVSYAKGVTYLLDAFHKIAIDNAELRLVGAVDKSQEFYKRNCGKKNIVFVGQLLHSQVMEELQKADVFVLPSLMEGMSLAGLEAMNCGLPIICTKNSGLDQFVTKKNGFIIDAKDTEQLYWKIQWFIKNRDLIGEMGDNAYETSKECSWEKYGKAYINMIESILIEC